MNDCETTYETPLSLHILPLRTIQTKQYTHKNYSPKSPQKHSSPLLRKMIGRKILETLATKPKKPGKTNSSSDLMKSSPLSPRYLDKSPRGYDKSSTNIFETENEHQVNFLEGFEVQFDIIFSYPQVQEHFHEYLRRTHNEEGFLFLMAVNRFKSANNAATQAKLANEIVETFLVIGSTNEVNIDNDSRTNVLDTFDKTGQKDNETTLLVSLNIFDVIVNIIRKEIKEDGFPRYVRTQSFSDFAHQQGHEFVVNILKPALDPNHPFFHVSQVLNVPYLRTSLRKFGNSRHEKIIDVYESIQKFKTKTGVIRKELGVELVEAIYDCNLGMDEKSMSAIQDGLDQEVDRIRGSLFDAAETAACKDIGELYARFSVSVIFEQCINNFVTELLKNKS